MDKWDAVSCIPRAIASGFLLYLLPEIAKASGHPGYTLLFGLIALFLIWVSGW